MDRCGLSQVRPILVWIPVGWMEGVRRSLNTKRPVDVQIGIRVRGWV